MVVIFYAYNHSVVRWEERRAGICSEYSFPFLAFYFTDSINIQDMYFVLFPRDCHSFPYTQLLLCTLFNSEVLKRLRFFAAT